MPRQKANGLFALSPLQIIRAGLFSLLIVNSLLASAWAQNAELNWDSPTNEVWADTLDVPTDPTPLESLQPYDARLLPYPKTTTTRSKGLKAGIKIDKDFKADVLFDETYTVHKGEKLVLTIMDMMASGYSEAGDTFHARVKEAVEQNGRVLIPQGALVKGHISAVGDPGSALRKRGKVELSFDYILMPDGRRIPLSSQYTKGDNALEAVGRTIGSGIGSTLSGAVKGVLLGLKFGGLQAAAVTNGATVITGGGLGALNGASSGLMRRGDHVLLNEGDEIKVALAEPLNLPVVMMRADKQNEITTDGIKLKVAHMALGRDPFKTENLLNLTLKIDNQTDYIFGSFDLALLDEYNNVYTVSPLSENNLVFQIPAHQQFEGNVAFSVQSPDVKHYVVLYKPYTRQILTKISLTEALKELYKTPGKKSKQNG